MVTNYIICIGFILLGAWWLYNAYAPRIKSQRAINWPTTEAEILASDIEEDRVRSSTGKANIAFTPTIRYSYLVNGTRYEGDRITFARAGFDFLDASNIRDLFAAGEKTPVHYNPSSPSESVLRPKSTVGMFSRIPGFFIFIIGLILLYFAIVQS
jgi:hypothetical protein